MTDEEYKKMSIKEFTKAAGIYEGDRAGIYKICKKDYPDILAELEKEPFVDLLDAGCGPAPMISLLSEKYPDRHYMGLDLTPAMIEQARKKIFQMQLLLLEIVRIFHLRIMRLMPLSVRIVFIIIRIHRNFLTV